MKWLSSLVASLVLLLCSPLAASDWSIAIHGGAGTLARESMSADQQAEYEAALQRALDAGARILSEGGTAIDAVKAAIVLLEDDPRFNAGRGAVFTWEGRNELDASIMDGRDRSAGAVTGVTTVRNPILLADRVRTHSPHVFLMGAGAEEFAEGQGIERAPPDWFATEARREALERMKAKAQAGRPGEPEEKFGTVGAVARDMEGNLAAGTSTGGMTGKRWGRIGDSPVIGAGTYADNRSCAVSATGWGEYFIRVGVAQEICTRLRLAEASESRSVRGVLRSLMGERGDGERGAERRAQRAERAQRIADAVMAEVAALGGDGGIILVTRSGEALFSFNTAGMYRARANSEGLSEVAIFSAPQ